MPERYQSLTAGLLCVACSCIPAGSDGPSAATAPPTRQIQVRVPDLSSYNVVLADSFRDGGTSIVEFENDSGEKYYAGLECPVSHAPRPFTPKTAPLHIWVARDWKSDYTEVPIGGEAERIVLTALEKWLSTQGDVVARVRAKGGSSSQKELTAWVIDDIVREVRPRHPGR